MFDCGNIQARPTPELFSKRNGGISPDFEDIILEEGDLMESEEENQLITETIPRPIYTEENEQTISEEDEELVTQ